jgi:hypothetical protein
VSLNRKKRPGSCGAANTRYAPSVPPNCSFEIDDLEKEWTWSKKFDLIFSRMMTGSFADPASIAKKAYE